MTRLHCSCATTLIVLALLATPCLAGDRSATAQPGRPCCLLDPDQRQPKAGQLAIAGLGGSFLGASVGSSYFAGGRAMYFVTRLIGLGVGYGNSRLAGGHDLGPVDKRSIHIVHGQLELSIDTVVRFSAKTVLEIDLFGTFGGGALQLAGNWEGMGVLGGGVRAYTPLPWLAVRIDVTNFLHRTRREDGNRFESNVAFTLGLSFLLPPAQARPCATAKRIE